MIEHDYPKISVGIPTYQRPDGLKRTLQSICKQTYPNLEIIVSDNGTSGSEISELVAAHMAQDKRVSFYQQNKNMGPTYNFQFVLQKAPGDYFMWAADDDWHELDFIQVLYEKLAGDSNAVLAFCNFDARDENGNKVAGFPNFYTILKVMTTKSKFLRVIKFFIAEEGSSKPHPIYGLIRRKALLGFSWIDFVEEYGWNGADVLFIFWLLQKGNLALSDKQLFGSTTLNEKSYTSKNVKWTLLSYSKFLSEQIKYVFGYIHIASGFLRIVIICLLPIKLIELLYLYMVKPLINYVKNNLKVIL